MLSARAIPVEELQSLGLVRDVADNEDQLSRLRDEYLSNLKAAAPGASHMVKELIRLAYTNAGDETQAKGIKNLFDQMMKSDSEAAVGLREFQAGRRNIDWDSMRPARPKL